MNALTTFTPGNVPAQSAALLDELGSNVAPKATVNSLSYGGKVWQLSVDGKKAKLERKNADGDIEPVQVMKVIIADYNKRRGRAYYEGDYNPDQTSAPLCWSVDGDKPDPAIKEPQAKKCDACPRAVKGSKITAQGKATVECPQHKMLAVIPAMSERMIGQVPPLRLKIAITSLYDKTSTDQMVQGWMAFDQYEEYLRSNGVSHTARVVTKMKFDPTVNYPKLFFAIDRFLTDEELARVVPIVKGDEIKTLLDGSWTPAGADGVKVAEQVAEPEEPKGPPPLPPKTQTTSSDEDDDVVLVGLDAPADEPVQEPAQAAVTPKAEPKKAEPKKAAAKAEAVVETVTVTSGIEGLDDLLEEWGD